MQTFQLEDFQKLMKEQGVPFEDVKFQCPSCKTLQSINDLIKAGAGKDINEVRGYVGFSCIGRFDSKQGCDWTLGGLLKIHECEVVTPDGKHYPHFLPVAGETNPQEKD